ncbi:hypothetical protein BY996DRAFT_6575528 [Phakopsora pachyrhizi]|nr:hypothetical protein BY996DRAFT_6575528 [Phakopsora pachyrhizi]
MPYNLSSREQLARTIKELEIEDLIESESDSDREEDILLLHDLYTKRYLLSKTYSPEDLMQLSPSNFKKLTQTTHIAFRKLCDLLRGDSIFYNKLRHKHIALEIQVAVGLSRLGSNGNGASIGKIQMIFGVGEGTGVLYTKRVIQAIHNLKDYKVKWPSKEEGKDCHDTHVFQQMHVWTNKEDYFDEGEYILADSAYVWASLRELQNPLRSKDEMESLIKWVVECIILHNIYFMDDETPESYNTSTDGNTQSTI